MIAFIDAHRAVHGVEPICRVLQIAPSTTPMPPGGRIRPRRRGPWRSLEAVEFATLEWVDWFNHRRLLEPIGNIPPAEAEARDYAQTEDVARAA